MEDSIWPKGENEQIFRFFNKDYQLMLNVIPGKTTFNQRHPNLFPETECQPKGFASNSETLDIIPSVLAN